MLSEQMVVVDGAIAVCWGWRPIVSIGDVEFVF